MTKVRHFCHLFSQLQEQSSFHTPGFSWHDLCRLEKFAVTHFHRLLRAKEGEASYEPEEKPPWGFLNNAPKGGNKRSRARYECTNVGISEVTIHTRFGEVIVGH